MELLLLLITGIFFGMLGLFRATVMGVALLSAAILGLIPWLGPYLAAGALNIAREILMEPAEPFKADDFRDKKAPDD